jgi:hypothetical protein
MAEHFNNINQMRRYLGVENQKKCSLLRIPDSNASALNPPIPVKALIKSAYYLRKSPDNFGA